MTYDRLPVGFLAALVDSSREILRGLNCQHAEPSVLIQTEEGGKLTLRA
jgi:hypothetical protein